VRSIRTQLLAWLLPGFAIVCVAAGVGVYFSERQAFEADLDARLGKLAGLARLALRTQGTSGENTTRGPTVRMFSTREEFKTPGQYFEQWTVGGAVERKSPNLESIDLRRPAEFPREELRYNAALENGDRVRVSAVRVAQIGSAPPADFAVALSRRDGDARLSRLIAKLVIGGLACCVVLCGLLALALRTSMRPLVRLGEQATTMGAASLHERFAVEAMPREIAPIVTRLNDLMARLEEGFERERRFSGYLAHELRTPLAAIRSTSEVALKWPEQATPEDHAAIARLAARLQQTVDSLLLLARAETISAEIVREAVPLRPLVEECAALHAERAREREVTLTMRLDETAVLQTDARLLRIIITNLIANAVEYAPPRSEVTLACRATDRLFEVTNEAPALTAEDVPNLFERLWRKDAARSDAAHAGLGLSLAQSCASALGLVLVAELDSRGMLSVSLRGEK
jgi:two-component system sensor histidine kinase QseC